MKDLLVNRIVDSYEQDLALEREKVSKLMAMVEEMVLVFNYIINSQLCIGDDKISFMLERVRTQANKLTCEL